MIVEVVFIELIRGNLQPIYNKGKGRLTLLLEFVKRYYEANDEIFSFYRIRGWILSALAPGLLVFPALLLYYSFADISILTPVYLLIFAILLVPWLIVPVLFMFYNPTKNKKIDIIAYIWLGIMLFAAIMWLIFIITL